MQASWCFDPGQVSLFHIPLLVLAAFPCWYEQHSDALKLSYKISGVYNSRCKGPQFSNDVVEEQLM